MLLKKVKWHWNWKNGSLIVLSGIVGNTISIVTQETGTWLSSAQLGSVITAATPTFMVIFTWFLLHEQITKVKLISLIMATVGVIAIVGIHPVKGHSLMLVIAALTWALMSVINKLIAPQYNVLQVTTLTTLVAIVALTPLVIHNWSATLGQVNFTAFNVWDALLYLGAVSTEIAFVMWNQGLKYLNAASSGLFFLFQPVVGTLLGWLLLNEQITWSFIIGAILIAGSIWYSIRFS